MAGLLRRDSPADRAFPQAVQPEVLRKRIGEKGVETKPALSIDAALRRGVIQQSCTQQLMVNTAVMPKVITRAADAQIPWEAGQLLIEAMMNRGIPLRLNHNSVAPRLAAQISRYAHVKRLKRMRCATEMLLIRVCRVHGE